MQLEHWSNRYNVLIGHFVEYEYEINIRRFDEDEDEDEDWIHWVFLIVGRICFLHKFTGVIRITENIFIFNRVNWLEHIKKNEKGIFSDQTSSLCSYLQVDAH